ncbi:unnamed protein product [Moneuplotes crassus]|uniref:Uncharacterized protein n=1 Tax=Euplotes crassus TaxID=5936 RepID=A0AAD1UGW4_EUPCR|nr:unnamed protein product [Moneuplotes crassus]
MGNSACCADRKDYDQKEEDKMSKRCSQNKNFISDTNCACKCEKLNQNEREGKLNECTKVTTGDRTPSSKNTPHRNPIIPYFEISNDSEDSPEIDSPMKAKNLTLNPRNKELLLKKKISATRLMASEVSSHKNRMKRKKNKPSVSKQRRSYQKSKEAISFENSIIRQYSKHGGIATKNNSKQRKSLFLD